jgi:hypothetical protein
MDVKTAIRMSKKLEASGALKDAAALLAKCGHYATDA